MSLSDWWKLARAEHALLVAFAVLVAEWFVGARDLSFAFTVAIPPLLVTLGSFILNDWADYSSDRANKRTERPLVSGKISKASALHASLVLFLIGILFAWPLGFTPFAIVLLFALLSAAYSLVLKKLPLIGNIVIAASMSISFIYGNLAQTAILQPLLALWAGIAFLTGLGRELLITLRDVKGDKKAGATTLPMLLGSKSTVRSASVLFLGAILLSFLPLQSNFSLLYLVLILLTNGLLLKTLLHARNPTVENLKRARNASLYALGTGLLAFASLAL